LPAPAPAAAGGSPASVIAVPPERHFPRPVIVIHRLLAVTTIVLVVVTVLFTGS
jgi:hypothetical protein